MKKLQAIWPNSFCALSTGKSFEKIHDSCYNRKPSIYIKFIKWFFKIFNYYTSYIYIDCQRWTCLDKLSDDLKDCRCLTCIKTTKDEWKDNWKQESREITVTTKNRKWYIYITRVHVQWHVQWRVQIQMRTILRLRLYQQYV